MSSFPFYLLYYIFVVVFQSSNSLNFFVLQGGSFFTPVATLIRFLVP
jgi:hypothetical protein